MTNTRRIPTSEDALQRSMVEWLNACVPPPPSGPWWTAVNPIPGKTKKAAGISKAMGMKAGTPDFVFCVSGRFVGVEVKLPGRYLSAVQRDVHSAISTCKGVVHTVRSIDDLEAFMRVLQVPLRVGVGAAA